MRTTIRLDDDLLTEAKLVAAEERQTLTAIFERSLREFLMRRRQMSKQARKPLPSFKGRGLQPGVDLDDSAALLELMEQPDDLG